MKSQERLLGWVVLAGVLLACNPDTIPGPDARSLSLRTNQNLDAAAAPLIEHIVAPQATDAAIDQFLSDHYAWLDTTLKSNHRLFVFMPGTGQRPAQLQLIQQEAARLGYHVIGLQFANLFSSPLVRVCPLLPDPNSCYVGARLEIIDGIDRSTLVDVSPANSIDNRLTKLLQYLADTCPDEGWAQFLDEHGGPKWPLIAVGGLSIGGGEAAMIGNIRLVDRVLMFSAVPDSIGPQAPAWLAGSQATPINRYYGLGHDRDGIYPTMRAGWDSLQLSVFGPAVAVESNEAPYGWTHMLFTDLTPLGGFVGQAAHASTATDGATPRAADGTPLLLDAWRYMLTGSPRRPGVSED